MFTLTFKICVKRHLSHYATEDLEVLDSYRTKTICGSICNHPSNNEVEIDVSNAYTASFCDMIEIAIFKELDSSSFTTTRRFRH